MDRNPIDPPRLAQRFLLWFLKDELAEEVLGDLDERFECQLEKSSLLKARFDYWQQVFFYLRPFAIRHLQSSFPNHITMYHNYFKISLRLFAKNKLYFLVNTFGIGAALACCMCAYLLMAYDIEFDRFHDSEKMANIYKVHTIKEYRSGSVKEYISAPLPLALQASYNQAYIKRYTRFVGESALISREQNGFREQIHFADSTFFNIFEFPLINGDHSAFRNKNTVFLSDELGEKLFGNKNPVGKTITIFFPNEKTVELTVGAILDHIPDNSSLVFDALIRIEHFYDVFELGVDEWGDWRDPSTFFELSSSQQVEEVEHQLNSYRAITNEARPEFDVQKYNLVPFQQVSRKDEIEGAHVNLKIPLFAHAIFGFLAVMILLIACFNLTNITIAISTTRFKELGIRKTVGARRKDIFCQFLIETVLTFIFSVLVGWLLSTWLVKEFQTLADFGFGLSDLEGLNLFIALVLFVMVSAFISGLYPALFYSRLHPADLVKATVRIKGTNWLSRILTTAQITLCIIFLIGGWMFNQNIQFQDSIDVGYDKENLLIVPISGEKAYEQLSSILQSHPHINKIAVTNSHLGYSTYPSQVDIAGNVYRVGVASIGDHYLETIDIRLLEGKLLEVDHSFDREKEIVVNEAFIAKTGLAPPYLETIQLHEKDRQIVGIVDNHIDDFSRSEEAEPFVFYASNPQEYRLLIIHAHAERLQEVNTYVEEIWIKLFPNIPFDSQFQRDVIVDGEKQTNELMSQIFLFLSSLGILLSLSGIFALASLNIAHKTKEIGIRKVLGASIRQIITLINREFVIMLTVAGILGTFVGIYLTHTLLDTFYAYFKEVDLLSAILCTLLVIFIGTLTTTSTILKAAYSNPIDSLRSE